MPRPEVRPLLNSRARLYGKRRMNLPLLSALRLGERSRSALQTVRPAASKVGAKLWAWRWRIGIPVLILVVLLACTIPFINPQLTAYVESDSFREMLNRQTSKGLKLKGEYLPIRRTGAYQLSTEGFNGVEGDRAIKALKAEDVWGTFAPSGMLLRRWELEYIHVERGRVELQKTEPKPDPPKPPKPWYAIFMPDRMYLKKVLGEHVDIVWQLNDKEAGIYDVKLEITPNDRDFEYRGWNGTLRMGDMAPHMTVEFAHILVRKPRLWVYDLNLIPLSDGAAKKSKTAEKKDALEEEEADPGSIKINGDAGLQEDKSIQAHADVDRLPLVPWLPEKVRRNVAGRISGKIDWKSETTAMEKANIDGHFTIKGGRIHGVEMIEKVAKIINNPALTDLKLNEAAFDVEVKEGKATVRDVKIEAEGVIALQGAVTASKEALNGTIKLGLTDASLNWLPKLKTQVFTQRSGGYYWTTIKVSGSPQHIEQDLTPRVLETLKESPDVAIGLFFKSVGEMFKDAFGGGK